MRNQFRVHQTRKSFQGFTLVELMVAMTIGLILFAGVMSVFIGMKTTTAETSTFGEMQENGRFAISILTDDLLNQGFFGDYVGTFGASNLSLIPPAPGNDCVGGGVNNATFPLAVGTFRTLWGQTVAADSLDPLGCFISPADTQTRIGSDVIQLKRVIGEPIGPAPLTPATPGNYFLTNNATTGGIVAFGNAAPALNNARTWEYQHHVYYVRDETVGNNVVPVLMQGRLANFNMSINPIIDGIEVIRFMYGIGSEATGVVDRFVSATTMNDALWDNAAGTRILAVKVYVLARSIQPDNDYENTNTYQLGNLALQVNDNFRRMLFTSTVTLYNGRVDTW